MALLSLLLVFGVGLVAGQSQETVLVNFNHVWKYDQSGLELGTAWRTNDFDDSSWPSGRALLGLEVRALPSDPFPYPLSIQTPLIVSTAITSYYFRTTFQFSGPTNDLSLIASNFVDDGCVIYLNGLEAGRVRMTNDTYNAATFAQFLATEGQLDSVIITNLALLRQGENSLAVQVHQSLANSSDVVWGMKLVTIPDTPPDPPTPSVITSQPESQTVVLGTPASFSVEAAGEALSYQWQKDGNNLANAVAATYSPPPTLAAAGAYRVIITNLVGSVTSRVATLTVVPDLVGPEIIAAVLGNSVGTVPFEPHSINVLWSKVVNAANARDVSNYTVSVAGTTQTVAISNVLYSGALGTLIILNTADPDWDIGRDYILTVRKVKDLRGNSIAPDTQVPVSRNMTNRLVSADTLWSFHNSAILEPDVADQDWFATNYVESAFWSSGRGIFHSDVQHNPCFAMFQTPITYQSEPTLFRTMFERPEEIGSSSNLYLSFLVEDGAVFFLNGREFYRTNVAPQGWPLDSSTRALADRRLETCTPIPLPVSGVLPGTNWLAAAVYENHGTSDQRIYFALELTLIHRRTPVLPAEPPPTLEMSRLPGPDNRHVLDWIGHGFALESTATFSNNLSYPLGPWIQVTNMANPYTNSTADPFRFFRLKK